MMARVRIFGERCASLVRRRDFVSGSITAAAAMMFVLIGSRHLNSIFDSLYHAGGQPDHVASVTLLLNIALILFAWSRHKEAKREMRARKAAEECVSLLRTRDDQTELLNRRSFRERAGELINVAREQRSNLALLVVNLNRFKNVNDVYGEAIGDGLLRIIAELILASAPRHAVSARLGSDEFAIAVPVADGEEGNVSRFACDLIRRLSLPIEVFGTPITVRAAIGMALLDFECVDFRTLLRRADVAMNAAREGDCGAPVWFDGGMERLLRARDDVEAGLRRGISRGEFVPYYQPIVELRSGKIRTLEMLARWQHPARGIVGADVFIPVAEETGFIGALSEGLMRAAFEEARHWSSDLTLAINVSPNQLADPHLAQKILKLLAETGFPARRLEVEITESSLFKNMEIARSVVASLKSQGIRLTLDDFGTGYSSLSHLRALPFDGIKIDRSFVLSLNRDPESWTIVKTIAQLGESLGVPITVEGIESAAIDLRVRDLGCELGQGWFYGQAASAAVTRQLLGLADPLIEPVGVDAKAA